MEADGNKFKNRYMELLREWMFDIDHHFKPVEFRKTETGFEEAASKK